MANDGIKSSKSASPSRHRHQITRSITELSSPIHLHRHHNSHHHRRERERDDKLPVPQSAAPILQGRGSLDAPRSDFVTPNLSPDASRRTSVLIPASEDAVGLLANAQNGRRPLREEDLRLEREKTLARATGLKKSMSDLATFSITTTRRLDDMYYSILEKLGVLQSTITALWGLAAMSRETNESFKRDTQELVGELEGQLDAFGQFDEQQRRIQALQERIQNGRQRIGELSERVDAVRERIEGWERADREWQERTRRRLKAIWVVMSVIVALVVLLVVSAQYASPALVQEAATSAAAIFTNESLRIPRNQSGSPQGEKWQSGETGEGILSRLQNASAENAPPRDNGDLRIFDEL